nr:heavy metal-associated isoprenylated plant protein 33-like isoform X2 [Ipomoea batatas]
MRFFCYVWVGVYIIKFEEEMGKVTVSGDVVPETLIRKLNKNGKHAELIGDPKENNGERVEDSYRRACWWRRRWSNRASWWRRRACWVLS